MTRGGAAGDRAGGVFTAIDAQDATAFVGFLTEDAVFRFGSAPAVRGREAIFAAVDGFFGSIAGCAHAIHKSIRDGATLVCEGEVTYRRHNGSEITLPFTDVLEYDGHLIADYKIYMDVNPLYAE
ncbi:MAG: nuclear transport factor 2 family protein [Gammaproteobacteria bacterium]|nr:nuclear transport factor 2 family protein [Gammaproteobacteria bacterium]